MSTELGEGMGLHKIKSNQLKFDQNMLTCEQNIARCNAINARSFPRLDTKIAYVCSVNRACNATVAIKLS